MGDMFHKMGGGETASEYKILRFGFVKLSERWIPNIINKCILSGFYFAYEQFTIPSEVFTSPLKEHQHFPLVC